MSREVVFKYDERCDVCGRLGAYDFMGDFLCADCSSRYIDGENKENSEEND